MAKKSPKKQSSELNEQIQAFCREYIIDFNGAQSAIRAGYSKKTAVQQASRLLTNVNVQSKIQELINKRAERTEITADNVVKELAALCFWNIQDFIGDGNSILDISKLDREKTKPVLGIKRTDRYLPDGSKQIQIELKMQDKHGPLADLGKHLGVFEKDNEQKSIGVTVNIT